MKSIADVILDAAWELRHAGVPEARREAGSLMAYVLGRDRTFVLAHADDCIDSDAEQRFRELVQSRGDGKPLQYITGQQEFYGLDFEVSPDVLIPRPETELLIDTALKIADGMPAAPFVCDVGTGSGCIPIALLHEMRQFPYARAVAIDVSEAALEVARRNAKRHALGERIQFVLSDCFAEMDAAVQQFDLIVSNPPYIAESEIDGLQREVRDFEPSLALTGGPDGLAVVRRLLHESAAFLKAGGHFVFEIGFDQGDKVEAMTTGSEWELLEIHKDLQGIRRLVVLRKP